MHVIRVDIFERHPYPVVRHEFRGQTRNEAVRYLRAHRRSDTFMDQCMTSGIYNKTIKCSVRITEFETDN